MVNKYIPKQGDIVYVDLNPTRGHVQKGKRPAVIISNNVFNVHNKMAFVCPITSNMKEYPTHYRLEDSIKIKGSVLCEHIKSIDYNARNVSYIESLSNNDLLSVMMLTVACIEN